jgi:hypothetical protein
MFYDKNFACVEKCMTIYKYNDFDCYLEEKDTSLQKRDLRLSRSLLSQIFYYSVIIHSLALPEFYRNFKLKKE